MLQANLSANGRFGLPGGYPCVLRVGGETVIEGVLPPGAGGVTATVQASVGVTPEGDGTTPGTNAPTTAAVHLALYQMPQAVGDPDGPPVGNQVDLAGLVATEQTIAISTPTDVAPLPYLFRLWVETMGTNGVAVTDLEVT